jgi:hypothetical protein
VGSADDTMSAWPHRGGQAHTVAIDLVQYLIISMPDLVSLADVARALSEMVESAAIRILDVVVLVRDREGSVTVLELEAVKSMADLGQVEGEVGGWLNDHDIELASFAVRAGTASVIVVTEDRWAEPLAGAARRAEGNIVAGERIPSTRVEAVLAESSGQRRERRLTARRVGWSPNQRTDLLVRAPCPPGDAAHGWAAWVVDPVDQLEELSDLYRRGLISAEELERQKAKVLES